MIFLFCGSVSIAGIHSRDASDQTVSVLFIGSSYLNYNNLPLVFENMAADAGKEVYIGRRILNGKYLDFHAASDLTETVINERKWDYVILQGVGPNLAYPDTYNSHPVKSSLQTLEQKIHGNHADTKMIYLMPWAFEDGMTWVAGWTDTYFDMQQIIYNKTLQMADDIDFIIAPVGWAFRSVMSENDQLHYLYLSDYNHPSVKGTYLAAAVFFCTVFVESCIGNGYTEGVSITEAEYFQSIASSTVLENPELWKLTTVGIDDQNKVPDGFVLRQNFPNPFNGFTRICYELNTKQNVQIIIYDNLGCKIATLMNEETPAGKHHIDFNSGNLASGTYFYRICCGDYALTKPMVYLK